MRVCSQAGCPTLYDTPHSRCPTHRAIADRARGTATDRGYASRGHKNFRNQTLTRDPICTLCGVRESTVADHYPISRRDLIEFSMDPNDPAHGRGLCKPCHDSSTAENQPGGWNTPN
ncbi:5-methylcytosine-specific restriction enzyme A [Agromyces cerinus subsp. cerinus]|uniref:5-methylcytosine-specific restriction enzyme A n=1 Tax=Agromyces cerinus subsp. cerinus TaxID=232089 RepID=A0A1N6DPL0_9MICO|nr:5-methylcytosine-specific restriction enzyme A [Agromyces cerinus subsp. cerinus]